jgi:hypothetical protein
MPWIITIPCWAHQINLVVGDLLRRSGKKIPEILGQALLVASWFTSHKRALSLLREAQLAKLKKVLKFIRAVITRWTTHYLSITRLIDMSAPLRTLVIDSEDKLLNAGGDEESQVAVTKTVIEIINSNSFWKELLRFKIYLQELAVAANVTQSSSTRLDHVLITLAVLRHDYSTDTTRYDTPSYNTAIVESLDKRWKALKQDQDVYILAVFLNPFIRAHYFNEEGPHSLTRSGLFAVVKHVYRRVFKLADSDSLPDNFFQSYLDYFDGVGRFSRESMSLDDFRQEFKGEVCDCPSFLV